jgi:hypothetical protein
VVPASRNEVAIGGPDSLTESADLLLGDGREDVRDDVRDLAALADAVRRHSQALEFLSTAHALKEFSAESVERSHDHNDRAALGPQPADVCKECLVLTAVVARAR